MLEKLEKINSQIEKIAKSEGKNYYFGKFFSHSEIPYTKVMFIGEKPTMPKVELWNPAENFNLRPSDKNFTALLAKYDFNNFYMTDIVKSVGPAGEELFKKDLDLYFPFLIEEISIINPKIIIALGKNAENTLRKRFELNNIELPIYRINHPSVRFPKLKENLEKQIKELSLLIKNLS